jgi:cyclopropane fatty-acyl-phospholipid synthase-like methyltransferase
MVTRDEQTINERFAERYREERADVVRSIERTVIGTDFGANGYTTVSEADELAALLELENTSLLLDVGAGRGWPGLYLAATTGCSVILTDVPLEGLGVARSRSRIDAVHDRAWCVNANARHLPFHSCAFDAVVHTDVLC